MENDAGKQFADSAALATEAVTSIKTISSLTLERQIMDEFTAAMDGVVSQSIRGLSVALIPYALSQSAEFLVLALGFWYGSRLIASGEYSTQQFFVVFIAVVSSIRACWKLTETHHFLGVWWSSGWPVLRLHYFHYESEDCSQLHPVAANNQIEDR